MIANLLFSDAELTGLNFRKDEMVSVAAVRIKKLRIVLDECFYSFLRTRQREATSGTFIHRITPQQIRAAPDPATVIPELVNFCGTAILVGHCLDIDLGFLNRATRRLLGAKIPNMSLDTAILVRAASQQGVLPGRVHSQQDLPNDLNRLAKSLNLPVFQHHDALEDALQNSVPLSVSSGGASQSKVHHLVRPALTKSPTDTRSCLSGILTGLKAVKSARIIAWY